MKRGSSSTAEEGGDVNIENIVLDGNMEGRTEMRFIRV